MRSVGVDYRVGVIGAGFSGLAAGLELLHAGRRDFVIFERAAEVGGVWRDNTYPGCACDIRSHLYSLERHPSADWSRSFAPQGEILRYLRGAARDGGLLPHIRFGAVVEEARWLDAQGCWRLAFGDGRAPVRVASLILATGPLNRAAIPPLKGLERFGGEVTHSAAWRGGLDLTGKRVGVVGTGASAVQIVPAVAPQVARLEVFQRSAAWVMPRGDRAIGGLERWAFRHLPGARRLVRSGLFWALEGVGAAFFGARPLHALLRAVALAKLRLEVRDPAVRRALTPRYPLGCKRLTVSDAYLPAFNRKNVHLVEAPILEVVEEGVVTASGLHRLDHLVFATGFTVADPDGFLPVVGRGGRVLAEVWAAQGAQAHRGSTIAGFPNLAMLLGPNSGLSYSSVVHVAESQMRYLLAWLDRTEAAGAPLDVAPERQRAYNQAIQARLAASPWTTSCPSWYIDRKGRNTVIYPGLSSRLRRELARFDPEDYVEVRA